MDELPHPGPLPKERVTGRESLNFPGNTGTRRARPSNFGNLSNQFQPNSSSPFIRHAFTLTPALSLQERVRVHEFLNF
jgi:hypothetical protein